MPYLYANEQLKTRRKDYRKFHRRFIKYLREEHSDERFIMRFYTKEKWKTHDEMARDLGVSRKTITRHSNDISYSDWLTLTGVYAQVKRKPDEKLFGGLFDEYSNMLEQLKSIFPKL